MHRRLFTIGEYSILTLSPGDYTDCPILYTHLSAEDAEALVPLPDNASFILAAIDGVNWDRKANQPDRLPERVYFSLGDLESMTRNQRLAKVEACTLEAEMLLKNIGVQTIYEKNSGNHFTEVLERIAKGVSWLLSEI